MYDDNLEDKFRQITKQNLQRDHDFIIDAMPEDVTSCIREMDNVHFLKILSQSLAECVNELSIS